MSRLAHLTSPGEPIQEKSGTRTAADLSLPPPLAPLVPPGRREKTCSGGLSGTGRGPRGVYVHVPFCLHKCHYCDFYSIAGDGDGGRRDRRGVFVQRLIEEIRASAVFLGPPIETIFFGGGTPTLLPSGLWKDLLAALRDHQPRAADCELTVEANPETVDEPLVEALVAGGVNRLSIGAQSFDPRHLRTLERRHDPARVVRSVQIARRGGVANINIDLIFGIPGQTLAQWLEDLQEVLALEPTHLSCYALSYESNTPLTAKLRAGRINRIDEDLEARMYEAVIDRLAAAGFEHYEISSWARPGRRCRHNLLYWRNDQWWPLGPAAAGHVAGVRWKNVPHLGRYLREGPLPAITDVERLDEDGRIGEELMLRLRLIEGIECGLLEQLLAAGARGCERGVAIRRHTAAGNLQRSNDRLRLTRHGLLVADSVLADLL